MNDADKAIAYRAIAEGMRADAMTFLQQASDVEHRPALLTFAQPYAAGLSRRYEALAEWCLEVAEQAQTIADDAQAHADGTYARLDPNFGTPLDAA